MYNDRIEIVLNKKNRVGIYDGCLFVNGESNRPKDRKIIIGADVHRLSLCKLPILSSSNKDALSSILKKEDSSKSLLICFGGKESDYKSLKQSLKDKSKWDCILIKKGLRYVVHLHWDFASQNNYFCHSKIEKEESFSEPEPKKEVSNANVDMPKPNKPKKADK